MNRKTSGFTIVELLVVIVVIGILAAMTIVSYASITSKAVATAMKADLGNANSQIMLYKSDKGMYPTSLVGVGGGSNYPSLTTQYGGGGGAIDNNGSNGSIAIRYSL